MNQALDEFLAEVEEYLEGHEDVIDGSDGPRPNKAMSLLVELRGWRDTLKRSQSEAVQRNAGNYRWMIENPYDVLLAFSEATNQDTYGLLRDAPIPEQRMREYLITRLDELMAMSSQSAPEGKDGR